MFKIIRLPEVIDKTGLSRSFIYKCMSEGCFPKSISLGKNSVGWIEAEVEQWISERITLSKAANHE
ncbi:AlpA family transcriptional regulator [Photobacterium leiognathi]|uniref:AlpA family transcriptional regulator n=1 Tax=Photobacterium leiognathi TaxID=553611 RepID=UPI00298106DD|nr:AlpA family transcriptional regulator [Photobacterium leiognathi]